MEDISGIRGRIRTTNTRLAAGTTAIIILTLIAIAGIDFQRPTGLVLGQPAIQWLNWTQDDWSGGPTSPILENGTWNASYNRYFYGKAIDTMSSPGNAIIPSFNNSDMEGTTNWIFVSSGVYQDDGYSAARYVSPTRSYRIVLPTGGAPAGFGGISQNVLANTYNISLQMAPDVPAGYEGFISNYFRLQILNETGYKCLDVAPPNLEDFKLYSAICTGSEFTISISGTAGSPFSNMGNTYFYFDDVSATLLFPSGNLTSSIFDSGSNDTVWGNVSWNATTPTNTSIAFQTRTSDDGVSWSGWNGTTDFEYPPDSSTVGLWHLNEGSGDLVADATGVNDGTRYGFTDGWVSGKFGQALSFDGVDDYVEVPHDSSLNFGSGSFTIEYWVKTGWKGVTVTPIIKHDTGWTAYWGSNILQNYVTFFIGDGAVELMANSISSVTDNEWHHIAGVRDGGTVKIYIDGVFEGEASGVVGSVDTSGPLSIGADVVDNTDYVNGTIDEVRISNVARSAEEIKDHYLAKAYTNLAGEQIVSPPGRYIQYRAFLSTEDPAVTPVLNNVTINYMPDSDGDGSPDFLDCAPDNASILPPRDDLLIEQNTTLCPGTWYVNDTAGDGAIIINASNVELDCAGAEIFGYGLGTGIDNVDFGNVTIKNCGIRNYDDGISVTSVFDPANGNRIINNTITHLGPADIYRSGIFIRSSHNVIENNTIRNQGDGIFIQTSVNNTIKNNIIDDMADGIFIQASNNTTIVDNVVTSHSDAGILIQGSINTTITNNNILRNKIGVLFQASNLNKMGSNTICLNSQYDINVSGTSENNTGTNNTCSFASGWNDTGVVGCTNSCPVELPRYANATVSKERPLVGDLINISANWSSKAGLANWTFFTNMSGVWTNITSAAISGLENETVVYPVILAAAEGKWVAWKINTTDVLGNWNVVEGSFYVPVYEKPDSVNIANGTNKTVSFAKADKLALQNITIFANATVSNVVLSAKDVLPEDVGIDILPNVTKITAQKVYKYLDIEAQNLVPADTSEVKIEFKIKKAWILLNDINLTTVALQRWDPTAEKWVGLPTTQISEDPTYYFFEATAPHLSIFAMAALPKDVTPPEIDIKSPLNVTYSVTDLTLRFDLDEQPAWCGWALDTANVTLAAGIENCSLTNVVNFTAAQGPHNLTVWANDSVGNMGSGTVWFTVNVTAPPPELVSKIALNETEWVDFGYTTDVLEKQFLVTNEGEADITTITAEKSGELAGKTTVSIPSGITPLAPGENGTISASVNLAGVAEGTRTGKIILKGDGSEATIDLSITVHINITAEADKIMAELATGDYAARITELAARMDVSAIQDLPTQIATNAASAKDLFAANRYDEAKEKLDLAESQLSDLKTQLPSLESLATERAGGKQSMLILAVVAPVAAAAIGLIFFLRKREKAKPSSCAVCGKPKVTHVCAQCGRAVEEDCVRSYEGRDYCLECAVALGLTAPPAGEVAYEEGGGV